MKTKLKRHREDVEDLKFAYDVHVHAIALRYQRLILFAEESFKRNEYYLFEITKREDAVLKDAEK